MTSSYEKARRKSLIAKVLGGGDEEEKKALETLSVSRSAAEAIDKLASAISQSFSDVGAALISSSDQQQNSNKPQLVIDYSTPKAPVRWVGGNKPTGFAHALKLHNSFCFREGRTDLTEAILTILQGIGIDPEYEFEKGVVYDITTNKTGILHGFLESKDGGVIRSINEREKRILSQACQLGFSSPENSPLEVLVEIYSEARGKQLYPSEIHRAQVEKVKQMIHDKINSLEEKCRKLEEVERREFSVSVDSSLVEQVGALLGLPDLPPGETWDIDMLLRAVINKLKGKKDGRRNKTPSVAGPDG